MSETSDDTSGALDNNDALFEVKTASDVVRLAEFVRAHIYQPIAPFEITAWRTTEPVDFANKTSGEELHLKIGDCWGQELFDCAWFRFSARLPSRDFSSLVARIDINGELAIVDEQGVPLRGLTCAKSTFDPTLGAPTKTIYQIPGSLLGQEQVVLWADAGFNDLFGMIVGEGRIELADICVCREDLRALYYDLQVLGNFLAGLPANHAGMDDMLDTIRAGGKSLSTSALLAAEEARQILKPLFGETHPRPDLQVSAIGHAHMDLAWLWPIRETFRKGARTFATALYNIERYPEYLYGCSQPQLFAWMSEHYPALYGKIKQAVKAGRIEPLGQFWVEPDCNIPNGESFVRQVIYGAQFFRKEFDIVPRFCWLPDVFGYNGQLPQILKKSGHDYFITQKLSWNIVNRFPLHSFHWEGIDGSTILAHMLPEETYNSPASPQSLRKISDEYAQKDVSSHALMSFGIGDGGGGPDAEHFERLERTRHLGDLPSVVQRSVAAFLEDWASEANDFPHWKGELYLERHQGTFTTQSKTKRNNRLCEIGLREAEWASILAEIFCSTPYPVEELDTLWQEVLLYQFHDVLPGSSIKRVYTESNIRYAAILQRLDEMIAMRYESMAAQVEGESPCVVFNSLAWKRQEWHKLDEQWFLLDVPAMGYSSLPEVAGAIPVVTASGQCLENEHLLVKFAADGSIGSIFDKWQGREVLAAGEAGNRFAVFQDDGDAWDFPTKHDTKDVWVYLRQEPQTLSLVNSKAWVDGPCAIMEHTYQFKKSRLFQRIILTAASPSLVFETTVDWQEPATMLRVRFPVAVKSSSARFEIPFGSIARSTGESDLIQQAQLEVPAQQWVDLSEEDHGVALLNDCKYGFRVKGHTLDMNLFRSVPHPGRALVGKGDNAGTGGNYTDLGKHEFRYALLPHGGSTSEAELTQAARTFNIPLKVVSRSIPRLPQLPRLPRSGSFITANNAAIEIAASKRAQSGDGWIMRLVNVTPSAQHIQLCSVPGLVAARETDLVENEAGECQIDTDGKVTLELAPFEIKTLQYWTAHPTSDLRRLPL